MIPGYINHIFVYFIYKIGTGGPEVPLKIPRGKMKYYKLFKNITAI